MSEVKRYQAVHIRYEDSNIRYGEGCEVDMVTASDFDKQAQEIERLNALLSRDPNVIVTELRQTRLSIDTPNQYKQDLIDCIIGAMAFGFQNTNPPPEGHWGKQFWDIGREEGNRQAELEAELSQLKSRQSGVVVERDAHWFSLVMGCAADLEQAAIGIYDEEAKRIANSGAEHYRKRANEAWQARAAQSSPNPAEQLNKAQVEHGEHDLGMVKVEAFAWTTPDFREPISAAVKNARPESFSSDYTVPLYTAPPSIPAITEADLEQSGLGYPLSKEQAVQLWHKGFRSEPITVLEAWEAIGHDIGCNPSKEELFDSLRNMSSICRAHGCDMPSIPETSVVVERELQPVLAMILNALDRDAAEGKSVRGEMADELRAILSSKGGDQK